MSAQQLNIAAPRSGDIDPKYLRQSASSSSNREMFKWLFMRISGPDPVGPDFRALILQPDGWRWRAWLELRSGRRQVGISAMADLGSHHALARNDSRHHWRRHNH